MFNFEDVKEINPITPGPRKEKCKLVRVERVKDDTKAAIFHFIDTITGGTLSHREFKPSRMENMTDDEYKKNITLGVARIAHIYRAYATEEQFKAVKVAEPNNLSKAVENWLEITKQVMMSLDAMIKEGKDMTCALKVVYRGQKKEGKTNWYASLPQVPAFISTASHPKDFVTNPEYDKYEIPTVGGPDAAQPAVQGATSGTTASQAAQAQSAFAGAASSGSEF